MEDEIPPDQPGPLAAAAEMEDREMERHLRLIYRVFITRRSRGQLKLLAKVQEPR